MPGEERLTPNAGMPWEVGAIDDLRTFVAAGCSLRVTAASLGRAQDEVKEKATELGLMPPSWR